MKHAQLFEYKKFTFHSWGIQEEKCARVKTHEHAWNSDFWQMWGSHSIALQEGHICKKSELELKVDPKRKILGLHTCNDNYFTAKWNMTCPSSFQSFCPCRHKKSIYKRNTVDSGWHIVMIPGDQILFINPHTGGILVPLTRGLCKHCRFRIPSVKPDWHAVSSCAQGPNKLAHFLLFAVCLKVEISHSGEKYCPLLTHFTRRHCHSAGSLLHDRLENSDHSDGKTLFHRQHGSFMGIKVCGWHPNVKVWLKLGVATYYEPIALKRRGAPKNASCCSRE